MTGYSQSYEAAFNKLMIQEGLSYTNDSNDHGGPTKFGLTQKFLEAYYKRGFQEQEIQCMGIDEAKKIYFEAFWDKNNYEQILNQEFASRLFSFCVHRGEWQANSTAQNAANILYGNLALNIDGRIGDKTIQIINNLNKEALLKIFLSLCVDQYRLLASNPGQSTYLLGWLNRLYK